MKRDLFTPEHELFRRSFRGFVDGEIKPHLERWNRAGIVDREVWNKAGALGFLCPWLGEEHGGPGGDFLHSVIVMEELAYAYASGFAMMLHSDVVVPYLASLGSREQKQRWLPRCAAGELVCTIAMTEPNAGSDLSAMTTTAVRDGDHYVLNGTKTFITHGVLCDLCVVAAKTDTDPKNAHRSMTLFVVEAGTEGFHKGAKLAKAGLACQDTAEMFFEDCRVPVANRLGGEGMGFYALMKNLQQERLCVAINSQATAEQVLADTVAYTKEREAFGQPIAAFQNTRFKLAECAAEVEVGRAFLDKLVAEHVAGQRLVKECSMSKLWHTEMASRVIDTCLQFFGGYGYMLEYPVCRAFMDARAHRIYAGTSEIMKMIIAKEMGL